MLYALALLTIQIFSGIALVTQKHWGNCPIPWPALLFLLSIPAGPALFSVTRADQYRILKTPKGCLWVSIVVLNAFRSFEWAGNVQDWSQALHLTSGMALLGWVWTYLA